MSTQGADIKNNEVIEEMIFALLNNVDRVKDTIRDKERQLEALVEECREEEVHSRTLLDDAKAKEQEAHVALIAARAAYAAAVASEIPAAIRAAAIALKYCKRQYQEAVEHRKRMEQRYGMAVDCHNKAVRLRAKCSDNMNVQKRLLEGSLENGRKRLKKAGININDYLEVGNSNTSIAPNTASGEQEAYDEWVNNKNHSHKALTVEEMTKLLSPAKEVQLGLLLNLVNNNREFKNAVYSCKKELAESNKNHQHKEDIIQKMSVRLAEELVKGVLNKYGFVEAGACQFSKNTNSASINLDVYELEVSIKLDNGLSIREGDDCSILIKVADSNSMPLADKSDLADGINGVILTANFSQGKNRDDFYNELWQKGYPVMGMLPSKQALEDVCEEFIISDKYTK